VKPCGAAILILPLLAAAAPAAAEGTASGHWLVAGHAAGKDFTVDCRFQQDGAGLSGACVDGETHDARVKGGRSHAVTKSHVSGDHVDWTYRSSFGLLPFDVNYTGVRTGDHMTGTVSAPGADGPFTADRKAP
jgi:hypothetical protein